MFFKVFLGLTVLLSLVCRGKSVKIYVPSVNGSYRAIGEIIIHDGEKQKLMTFEENFDQRTQTTSFWSTMEGINTTIIENLNGGGVSNFQYNLTAGTCKQFTPADWDNSELNMKLRPAQEIKGSLIFPIREFLGLTVSDIDQRHLPEDMITYQGVLAVKYIFRVPSGRENLEVIAYWTDKRGGNTMSKNKEVPLGFIVNRVISEDVTEAIHVINLFYFMHDQNNDKMLQPIRGIYCPDRKDTEPFPDLKAFENFLWSAEFTWAERDLTTSIDAWVDMGSKLLRVDFKPLETLSGVEASVEKMIISFDEQAVFHMNQAGKRECQVTYLHDEPYYPQMVMDPRNQANWFPGVFFGTKDNKYARIGQVIENGFPCDVYQAQRKDWPPGETKVTSIWEWCITNNVLSERKGQLPLVSLKIYVTDSPYDFDAKAKPYTGQQISYQFYNARQLDTNRMETLAFDISPCFTGNRKLTVSFLVELKPSEVELLMEIDSDVKLNSLWRQEAYVATNLSPSSLRIARPKTSFLNDKGPLVVQLTLLDQHPNLPRRVESNGIDVIKQKLETAINREAFAIMYTSGKSAVRLVAKSGSFQEEKEEDTRSFSLPLAFHRTLANIEEHKTEEEAKEFSKRKVPWIVGILCLQVGVALGIIGVALLKKRKTREDQVQLVNEECPASNTQVSIIDTSMSQHD